MHYNIRRVRFGQHVRPVLLQSVNGPCPLLAICNVLLLRGQLTIHPQQASISFEELRQMLTSLLKERLEVAVNRLSSPQKPSSAASSSSSSSSSAAAGGADRVAHALQQFEDVTALLPKLEQGLDINVSFAGCAAFEFTPEIALFDGFDVTLVHGWVIDPEDRQTAAALDGLTYNQAVNLLTSEEVVLPGDGADGEVVRVPTEDRESQEHRRIVVQEFLKENAGQFTVFGLSQMHQALQDGQLAVYFRNNHFATILKRNGYLFTLITDSGIVSAAPYVVWQRIGDIDGDDTFLGWDFRLPTESNRDPAPPLMPARGAGAAAARRAPPAHVAHAPGTFANVPPEYLAAQGVDPYDPYYSAGIGGDAPARGRGRGRRKRKPRRRQRSGSGSDSDGVCVIL